MQDQTDLIINPIRLRIIQYTAHNTPATVAQIAKAMSDISKATLYRHVRVLVENEILTVVGQEKIRGTYEQSYSLNLQKLNSAEQGNSSETQTLVYSMLAKLIEDFRRYFNSETANPIKDKLYVGTNALYLDDNQFADFTEELYTVVQKYSQTPSDKNGKARMITIISSPVQQENDKEE